MKITIDLYDVELEETRLREFLILFSDNSCTLELKRCGKDKKILQEASNSKRTKQSKSLRYFNMFEEKASSFVITVMKTATHFAIIFDKFYSLNVKEELLEGALFKLIAQLFGYQACECSGFTVKNREGQKIQPVEIIYIKNSKGIVYPQTLKYVKKGSINISKRIEVKCISVILRSILGSKPLNFELQGETYTLILEEGKFFLLTTSFEDKMIDLFELDKKKEERLSKWFESNVSEYSKALSRIYIDRDPRGIESLRLKKAFNKKQVDYFMRFLTVVPTFSDERDDATELLLETLRKSKTIQNLNLSCDYLKIKNKPSLDRKPFCSIKEWLEND